MCFTKLHLHSRMPSVMFLVLVLTLLCCLLVYQDYDIECNTVEIDTHFSACCPEIDIDFQTFLKIIFEKKRWFPINRDIVKVLIPLSVVAFQLSILAEE